MIQRRTQTASYWQEQFEIGTRDITLLYDLILEAGTPVAVDRLAIAVIDRHCRHEEGLVEAELSKGPAYQPREDYQVGQQVIFPALDYVLGTVTDTREGWNPEYGTFTVIEVEFEGEDGADQDIREFASALEGEHVLNQVAGEAALLATADLRSPADLYESYGEVVEYEIIDALMDRQEFVPFGDAWFLKDLLVEISDGHLHLAEALIEIKSMPIPTADFLQDLDLPAEVSEEIRILSLNRALTADERFDNVGDGGRDIWFLRRMTPETVVKRPAVLIRTSETYNRQEIDQELLLIEREIDDEGSGEEVMGASRPLYRTTISLIYPHWRAGTLPLTTRTSGLFPTATTHHTPIVLVDGKSGEPMQGWVVHQERFVHGLKAWYDEHKLPVGAFIKLERTRDPRVIRVDFEERRLKRLWITTASIKDGKLEFHLRKLPVACEFDDQITISEIGPADIDKFRAKTQASGASLFDTMTMILPELVQLSPQGTVHAKTIYSAVNVVRRTAPGPIFAQLSSKACFVSMGGGYWTFDEALLSS